MDLFKYGPLDLDGPAFRLVRLCHGEGPDIECELFQAWLYPEQSLISYEALSYTWGSIETVESIRMNGQRHGITLNLYIALQHLRFRARDRILWVDSICIDQVNDKERGHQVRHMGDIYKRAERVIFWLGQPTYETNLVLDSLRQLQKESTKHACKTWELSDPRWVDLWSVVQPRLEEEYREIFWEQRQGLEELLSRPWFRRVWILQEVANARAGLVCCGQMSVSASIFSLAPLLIDMTPNAHCRAVLDIMPGPSRSGTWWNMNRDLYTLLRKFRASESSLPRDMVFALLGISSDAQDTDRLRPDYDSNEASVIRDVVCFLFDDHIYRTQQSYFHTLQDLIRNLELLNTLFLQHYMESPNLMDLENILERRGFGTTEADISAAAHASRHAMSKFLEDNARRYGEVDNVTIGVWDHLKSLETILQRRGYKTEIMTETLLEIIKNTYGGPDTVDFLLQGRVKAIKITEAVIIKAISCLRQSSELEEFLVEQYTNKITIREAMLKAMVSHPSRALELIQLLVRLPDYKIHITEDILIAAVSSPSYGLNLFNFLFQQRYEIKITGVLSAAALSLHCGLQLMKHFFLRRDNKIKITKRLLNAGVSNIRYGIKLIRLLLQPQGDRIQVKKKVLKSMKSSMNCGLAIVLLVKVLRRNKVRITDVVLRDAELKILIGKPRFDKLMRFLELYGTKD
ncbi:hypothetical protein ABOM_007282 [Aspergillus bombycis]|uniref:Heterokaryon incompatibility domain-containing protein n=1 Tax=Aspergillus bombycis TaxID=109264 RepID=A0A1F7ZXZ5_9EURO|nr:hypothetical protein ABOM_007282 [Aspergillus bombycis]OGM44109.1 hypothetical protein ABOM_007282 [Aspergillus bombycis]